MPMAMLDEQALMPPTVTLENRGLGRLFLFPSK
jgi:hypothetical protein